MKTFRPKFMVQWIPRGKKYPHVCQEGPIVSFEAALYLAQNDGHCANAKSVQILKTHDDGINADRYFLDFIVK